ncbi:MAG: NAD-dependent epimerase/dehydratase family protein [Bacteroides sp.]|nr:NAD-dependent epimerase/dehydratase family protein [Roseburia sp.]MCM1347624.1 NAD-dependent epimerase/dehydratase family protein [Bacteroides sp.]MCM1422074.1 NAD-dependent epimerase/dehydratase family protein [Bacteroides sp.]
MNYKYDIEKAATLDLPWEKLSGCNIMVTGATGLIGSCLIEVLMSRKNRNYTVYASGRNEERARKRFKEYWNDPNFQFFPHDVIEPLKGNIHFNYIIHAASNASPNFFASKPVEVIKSNINGISNLFDYGLCHGLKRLLFVSSGEVYGEGDGRVFTEEYSGYVNPISARSCYPSSKRAAETLCISYGAEYGIETVIARPCHVYGPNFTEQDNRVYAQFIRNILNKENIVMKSTGSQYRSWCYVVDCVSALLHILLKGETGQAYNIADATSNISIKQLAEMIANIGEKEVVITLPSDAEKAGYNVVSKAIFSTEKLENLGWSINGSMQDKIRATIEFEKMRNTH